MTPDPLAELLTKKNEDCTAHCYRVGLPRTPPAPHWEAAWLREHRTELLEVLYGQCLGGDVWLFPPSEEGTR